MQRDKRVSALAWRKAGLYFRLASADMGREPSSKRLYITRLGLLRYCKVLGWRLSEGNAKLEQ